MPPYPPARDSISPTPRVPTTSYLRPSRALSIFLNNPYLRTTSSATSVPSIAVPVPRRPPSSPPPPTFTRPLATSSYHNLRHIPPPRVHTSPRTTTSPPGSSRYTNAITKAALAQAFPPGPGRAKARRPRAGNEVVPSPFRPHVPAEQRLVAWTTPHGLSAWGGSEFIPAAHKARVMVGMAEGLAKNSRSTYAAGLLRFAQYCDDIGVPEERRMPADALLLACWIAHSIGTHGRKSAKGWLDGVAYWHALNLAPWSGDDECVKKVLRAVDKEGKFTRPPRGPVTVEHLRALRATMDVSTPRDAAFWALACSAFWGCRRLGELTIPKLHGFDASHDVSRSSSLSRSISANRRVISIHLPWTKTTGSKGGTLILTETFDDLCPIVALENHFAVNHSPLPDTPLFAYCIDGSWTPTVKASFLDFFSDIVRAAGLDKVLGHSFRIGGSVFLLCSGVEPEIVMKIGGWSSTCFLIYWRRLETVIPVALARAWDKLQKAFQKTHKIPDDVANEVVFMVSR
ncbi:hypothetical protein MKEN_00946500 [Mycena kentingensis (nom. inval.)]|nr:hypothetical protein MKEN_00946500 [Mycena kentingensis (nom. inval.)]